jgi:hypothetical protein
MWLIEVVVWFHLVSLRMMMVAASSQLPSDPDIPTTAVSFLQHLQSSSSSPLHGRHSIYPHRTQQEEQPVTNDVLQMITNEKYSSNGFRILQDFQCNATAAEGAEDACVLQPPEAICEMYNNQTDRILTCTCSRFGAKDTQVDCTYIEPQCNIDNTTCYMGSISEILNVALQSRVVTTCTTYLTSFSSTVPLNTELCIRVFPFDDGFYETLSSCSVSLQPEPGSEAKVCNSCTICDTPSTNVEQSSRTTSNNSTGNSNTTTIHPNIRFNCCNVVPDIQQSCAPVHAESGVAIPQYDTITPETQGTCTSHGTRHFDYYYYYYDSDVVGRHLLWTMVDRFRNSSTVWWLSISIAVWVSNMLLL